MRRLVRSAQVCRRRLAHSVSLEAHAKLLFALELERFDGNQARFIRPVIPARSDCVVRNNDACIELGAEGLAEWRQHCVNPGFCPLF